jgi:bifunctional non-homologous end joining protein LigD
MILTASPALPAKDDEWAYELKWDGMRAVVTVDDGGDLRVYSRHGTEHTVAFPELRGLVEALRGRSAILDGELVCQDQDGRPSFARIRKRWIPGTAATAAALAKSAPATFVAFDLLEVNGTRITARSYEERRQALAELELRGPHWLVTDYQVGQGAHLAAASQQMGLEGIVAKRLRSAYRPGVQSSDWRKLKNFKGATYLIGGWIPTAGDGVEALLVGTRAPNGQLEFAGTVEFGLDRQRQKLRELLQVIAASETPFRAWRGSRRSRWVRPLLAAEVKFLGFDAGVLREAIFQGVSLATEGRPNEESR